MLLPLLVLAALGEAGAEVCFGVPDWLRIPVGSMYPSSRERTLSSSAGLSSPSPSTSSQSSREPYEPPE